MGREIVDPFTPGVSVMLRTSSTKTLAAMLGLVALLLAANLAATLFGSGGPSIAAPAMGHAGGGLREHHHQ